MDIPVTAEKYYCVICSQKKFPKNENLIQHMSSVHKRIIAEKKKCDDCMIPFLDRENTMGMIHERISHLITCYLGKKENKTKVDFNSNKN